jgi:hypothetical protein
MTCDQAAEFISELFDGQLVPREAALHLDQCPACRQRLADYSRISVELRRYASAKANNVLPEISWKKNPQQARTFWDLGRQTMRIPRFAFALMLIVIAVLSTGLMLVRARDNQPWWFEMNVRFPPHGGTISSILDAKDFEAKPSQLDFVQPLGDSQLAWSVRLISSKDGAQQIGIRAREVRLGLEHDSSIEEAHAAPEQVDWYVPGKRVDIEVPGSESHLEITAELLSEAPTSDLSRQTFLPKSDELRLIWPVLLRAGKFVGGLNGATAEASGDGIACLYVPGQGLFLFSRESFDGASEAKVENSQVRFSLQDTSYLLLTGAPIASFNGQPRGTIWVRHVSNFKFRTSDGRDVPAVLSVAPDEVPKLASHIN